LPSVIKATVRFFSTWDASVAPRFYVILRIGIENLNVTKIATRVRV